MLKKQMLFIMKKLIIIAIFAYAHVQSKLGPNRVDISGLDKVELLQALFKKARFGHLHPHSENTLSEKEAKKIIKSWSCYADCEKGRVMKVSVCDDIFRTSMFNAHNGEGAAEEVIAQLRQVFEMRHQQELEQQLQKDQADKIQEQADRNATMTSKVSAREKQKRDAQNNE